jgi:hypothetical protein
MKFSRQFPAYIPILNLIEIQSVPLEMINADGQTDVPIMHSFRVLVQITHSLYYSHIFLSSLWRVHGH